MTKESSNKIQISVLNVFTPYKPAGINYIERKGSEEELQRIFSIPGMQINIKGIRGCGKSSLVQHFLKEKEIPHIATWCTASHTAQLLIENTFHTLREILLQIETTGKAVPTSSYKQSDTGELITQTYFNCYDAPINQTTLRSLLPKMTNDNLCRCLGASGLIWIVEEIDVLPTAEQEDWLNMLILFNGWVNTFRTLRIITVGRIKETGDTLCFRKDVGRKITEIEVPLMTNEELAKIISTGEDLLNVEFAEHLQEELKNIRPGTILPENVHKIFLNKCLKNRIEIRQKERRKIKDRN